MLQALYKCLFCFTSAVRKELGHCLGWPEMDQSLVPWVRHCPLCDRENGCQIIAETLVWPHSVYTSRNCCLTPHSVFSSGQEKLACTASLLTCTNCTANGTGSPQSPDTLTASCTGQKTTAAAQGDRRSGWQFSAHILLPCLPQQQTSTPLCVMQSVILRQDNLHPNPQSNTKPAITSQFNLLHMVTVRTKWGRGHTPSPMRAPSDGGQDKNATDQFFTLTLPPHPSKYQVSLYLLNSHMPRIHISWIIIEEVYLEVNFACYKQHNLLPVFKC